MNVDSHEPGDFIPDIPLTASWAPSPSPRLPRWRSRHSWAPTSSRRTSTFFMAEKDLHRLDPTGAEHGFIARFQRTLIRAAGPAEEFMHLKASRRGRASPVDS